MQAAVKRLLDSHPRATLQDIYKSCFQDRFGVAHALSDREKVEQYIVRETERAEQFEPQYIEPCGWRGDFVRVNLKAVRDGILTASELADAFMASQSMEGERLLEGEQLLDGKLTKNGEQSKNGERPLECWQSEWRDIMRAVRCVAPDLADFQRDSTAIATLLAEGKYVMHHSKTYNEHYHPHYRIVRRDIFEHRFGSRF